MSASLVGSEMCIRDRSYSMRADDGPGQSSSQDRGLWPEGGGGPARRLEGPVDPSLGSPFS
eukprot:646469-Alexandrium_andersonii.AAC.1